MKIKLRHFLPAFGFFITSFVSAQNFVGLTMDNYSGVNGVILNPSAVVDSNFRTDINLFSMSSFLGSDYYSIDLNAALESEEGFSFGNSIKTSATNENQFFLNVDVLGPSFMFNLNPKSSLAVTTRVRTFLNFNNVNGMIYEDMEDGFNSEEDYSFEMKDFSSTVHAWGELGLTYGRILMDTDSNFLKAGLTVKYLQGAGATFIHSPQATGQYEAQTELLTTSGTLSYGSAIGFESDDIDFNDLTSGFGADFGVTYEYRPDSGLEEEKGHSDYKFRLGLSVTDLGSISYESTVTTYDLDETVDANRFDQEGLRTVLEQEYEGTEEMKDTKISLPTALHIMGDYNISKHFYVSVQANLSLVSADAEHANRIINTVAATPRFESKWFSFYLPVSMRQYDGLAMGAGFRLGPLMVGSGSLISNVLGDSAKTTDIYAGVKIPIYR